MAARTRPSGVLAAVNAATENRRTELLTSGAQLNRLVDQLDAIVATDPGPSTVSALVDATRGLQQTAPELVDALHQAVQPMQTLVEQRAQLTALINGGVNTMGTTHTALNNHTDRLVQITSELTPVIGEPRRHLTPLGSGVRQAQRSWRTSSSTRCGCPSSTPATCG